MSELKVPELRFREFSGEWEEKRLGDITKINQGLQIVISKRFTEEVANSYFYITNEFLKENSEKKYFIKNPSESVLCDVDDVLMTRTGNTGQVVTNVKGAFHNNFFKIKYSDDIYKNFLVYFLRSVNTQNNIMRLAGASTIPDLNHGDFYKLKINLPEKQEQEKIASFLNVVDVKIEQLISKRRLLQEYKKGVMQKIFSQEIRFRDDDGSEYPEWVEKRFLDNFDTVLDFRGRTPLKMGMEWGNGNIISLSANNVKDGYIDFKSECNLGSEELYVKWMGKVNLEINDIIFTMEAPLGKALLIPDSNKYILSQRVVAFKTNDDIDNKFFIQLIWSRKFQNTITKLSTGSTAKGINQKSLRKILINIPSLKEQRKIASFLSSIDSKIEQTQTQLNATKEFKKALLQQMFV